MHRIMRHVVKEISEQEADKERRYQRGTQKHAEQKIEQSRQWDAYGRNHHQSFAVTGIIVVNTVEYKMDALTEFARQLPVKYKTVQHVFCQCPDKNTACNQQRDPSCPK